MLGLRELLKYVEPIIREAGFCLLSFYGKRLNHLQKEQGYATDADLATEEFLIKELSKLLPHASFFAEESGQKGNDDYCWVIDPLDGTTNFAQNLGYFCISIALTYRDSPILGMIYQPLTDELFYSVKDGGAFYNGTKVLVSQKNRMNEAIIMVGFPYFKGPGFNYILEQMRILAPSIFAFRHMGAVALDQAYIACGKADGIFFQELGWWDCAAGLLLLEEAGAKITDFQGKSIGPAYHSFIAANPLLYEQLLPFFKNGK